MTDYGPQVQSRILRSFEEALENESNRIQNRFEGGENHAKIKKNVISHDENQM